MVAVPDPGEHQSVWRRRRRGRRPLPRRAQREQHVRRRPRRRLAHRRRHQHAHEFPQKPIRDEFDHQHPFRRLVPATRGVRLRSLGRRLRSRVAFPARVSSSPRVLVPADARHGALERARHLERAPRVFPRRRVPREGPTIHGRFPRQRGEELVHLRGVHRRARGSIFAHQLSRGKDVDVASPRRAERGVERGVDSSRTRGDAQDPRSTRGRIRDPTRKRVHIVDVAEGPKRHALRGAVHALIRSSRGLNRSG